MSSQCEAGRQSDGGVSLGRPWKYRLKSKASSKRRSHGIWSGEQKLRLNEAVHAHKVTLEKVTGTPFISSAILKILKLSFVLYITQKYILPPSVIAKSSSYSSWKCEISTIKEMKFNKASSYHLKKAREAYSLDFKWYNTSVSWQMGAVME